MSNQEKSVDKVEDHIRRRFILQKKIGQGAYGVVFKSIDRKTKETVALKKLFGAFRDDTDSQRTFREVMLLQELNGHDNIIRLLNVIKAENDIDLYLIFDYMEADLFAVIRSNILQDIHKKFIIYQTLKALKFIHSADIIHRDLKPSNIFLNSDCHVKLGDFGLARTLNSGKQGLNGVITDYVATRWYRAPEMLLGSINYGKPIDMWSVGCILFELLVGRPLLPGKSTKEMIVFMFEVTGFPDRKEYDEVKEECEIQIEYDNLLSERIRRRKTIKQLVSGYCNDPVAIDLLGKLLLFNPKKRLTAEEALEHPYVADFHNVEEEIVCDHKIRIPLDDNVKYGQEDYKRKLYDVVLQRKMEIRKQIMESMKKEKEMQMNNNNNNNNNSQNVQNNNNNNNINN
jgi:mitogen-activated protein kinase 15